MGLSIAQASARKTTNGNSFPSVGHAAAPACRASQRARRGATQQRTLAREKNTTHRTNKSRQDGC
ncbi:hypothetical protein Mapa_014955 [Marchantia paleacea]|nr:hypothetical protein Mapa_014955 [Marchantia paleacea]